MVFALALVVALSSHTDDNIAEELIRVGPKTTWVISSAKAVREVSEDGQEHKIITMPSDPYMMDTSGDVGLWVSSDKIYTYRGGQFQNAKIGEKAASLIRSSIKDPLSSVNVSIKGDTFSRLKIINQVGQDSKMQAEVYRLSTGEKICGTEGQRIISSGWLLELPSGLFPSAKTKNYRLVPFSNPSRAVDLSSLNGRVLVMDRSIRNDKLWFCAMGDVGQKSMVGVVDVAKGSVKTWLVGEQLRHVLRLDWFSDGRGASLAYLSLTPIGQVKELKFLKIGEKQVTDGPTVKLEKIDLSGKQGASMGSFDDGTILIAGQEGYYIVKGRGASVAFHGWK